MDKTFQPNAIEQQCYAAWETQGCFAPRGFGAPYCIMIPPPNVTGSLHMGHGFQNTLMDALIRYHRMMGDDTLWQVGTDHAGIATQMVVERQLQLEQKTRHDLGRDDFIDRVWQWKETSGGTIAGQLKRLGASMDWSRERFTMDDGLSHAVQEVFIRLFDEGLIYRGQRLVNWDPAFRSAISDLEVISEEEQGSLWHIRYPITDSEDYLIVATTRPETLLGDSAVAVHPDDARYQHLIGKTVSLPLCDREIPIIADSYVDPEFGSGCVKITPAHDFNDNIVGQRHHLPLINIFTPDAVINSNAPVAYQDLDRFVAREKIIADLQALQLLEKIVPHTLKVPRGDRSGVIIEPYLTDQWFVHMTPLAAPALEAVQQGKITFVPENWTKTYYQWLENIEDWCISRQLWWGHRIPAWYDHEGNVYVAADEASVRSKYQLNPSVVLTQDDDVLDTWFSSALWPFSTLGWPEKTIDLQKYYPTNVLVTGFDIIFFWVARMIMLGLKFAGDIPFREVYITGLIRDSKGNKMSKTKGNVLDPLDLVDGISLDALLEKRTQGMMQEHLKASILQQTKEEFPNGIAPSGTDALRFTFCALASTGRDINFQMQRLESNRNFCNKLWNAARYVLQNTVDKDNGYGTQAKELALADRWILARLQQLIGKAHHYFATYRFDLLAKEIYEFTWNEYCDWYLELSKPVLYADDVTPQQQRGTRYTLLTVLDNLLRLIHPLMPFITETIWLQVAPLIKQQATTIMLQAYPLVDDSLTDEAAIAEIEWLKLVILGIRNIRGEMNIAPSKQIPAYFQRTSVADQQRLRDHKPLLIKLAKLVSVELVDPNTEPPASAMALAGTMEILVPLAGLIDVAAEQTRLERELQKLIKESISIQGRLNNSGFVNNAPTAVVEKEKARVVELSLAIEQTKAQFDSLKKL